MAKSLLSCQKFIHYKCVITPSSSNHNWTDSVNHLKSSHSVDAFVEHPLTSGVVMEQVSHRLHI